MVSFFFFFSLISVNTVKLRLVDLQFTHSTVLAGVVDSAGDTVVKVGDGVVEDGVAPTEEGVEAKV